MNEDLAYLGQRLADELERATTARNPKAAQSHFALVLLYSERISKLVQKAATGILQARVKAAREIS